VSPKSFVRQVLTALARETDAFRPATCGIRPNDVAGQVVAALARVPVTVLPEPGPSSNDLGVSLPQNDSDPITASTSSGRPSKEQGTHPRVQVGLSGPPLPQVRRPTESTGRLLSVGQAAHRLGVSRGAVYRMIHRGKLVAVRNMRNRSLLIPEDAVDKMAMELSGHSDTA